MAYDESNEHVIELGGLAEVCTVYMFFFLVTSYVLLMS